MTMGSALVFVRLAVISDAGTLSINNKEFSMRTSIADYKELIRSFVSNEISALQFEEKYLKLFKRDDSLDEKAYKVLSPLFWAVEDFCS
ncbi:MAG: hypothetical protein GY862_28365, partial [Gammaproteobacteria bacterium]|nr:hypothetical protein [Gammaproteobacteria bacterium]